MTEGKQICERSEKVLYLADDTSSIDLDTQGEWKEFSDVTLNQPKSSATILVVPDYYVSSCIPKPET